MKPPRVTDGIDFVHHTTRTKHPHWIVWLVVAMAVLVILDVPLLWFGILPL